MRLPWLADPIAVEPRHTIPSRWPESNGAQDAVPKIAVGEKHLRFQHGFGTKPADLLSFHSRLLFGTDPTESIVKLQSLQPAKMVTALLSTPEAQLS
jgi:hypothetical protein